MRRRSTTLRLSSVGREPEQRMFAKKMRGGSNYPCALDFPRTPSVPLVHGKGPAVPPCPR